VRNLVTHLLAVGCVYGIGFLLSRSRAVAAAAALAFGVNPYVNQAVVVAIWTNTTAYAAMLGSLLAFLYALRRGDEAKRWAPVLGASLALALVAMFTYEPTIVILGIAVLYLILVRRFEVLPARGFLIASACGTGAIVAAFFAIRRAVGVEGAPPLAPAEIVRSLTEYVVALVLPIDPLLGNTLFGIPLPVSGGGFAPSSLYAPLAGLAVLIVALACTAARPLRVPRAGAARTICFCFASIVLSLLPIVAFRAHVSEYNLYVPAALYAIAIAIAVRAWARDRTAFAAVMAVVVLFSAGGVIARNARVIACARIVTKIVDGLPIREWSTGRWYVRVATSPNETLTVPYGIYDYSGLQTIEVASTKIHAFEKAMRLASGNQHVHVELVDARSIADGCAPRTCYYVSPDGAVEEVIRR